MSEGAARERRVVAALPGLAASHVTQLRARDNRPCDDALDGRLSAPRDDGREGGFESTAGTGEEGGGLASIEF